MEKSILSIQSHVAHGFVGGRAATFPLQLLGWDVDVVNTVNFSNHSGYRRRPGEGTRSTGEQLEAIFHGLEMNGLLEHARLLTGYTPNADCLGATIRLVARLRKQNKDLIFLLDPVLGDNGRLYVAPDAIPLYRELLSSATIITPNWFEAETLVDFKLDSLAALRKALTILHTQYGVPNVVISSIPITNKRSEWMPKHLQDIRPVSKDGIVYSEELLLCITSTSVGNAGAASLVHATAIPQMKGYFTGAGDFFSAMVLGHYQKDEHLEESRALTKAVNNAIRTTHAVLRKTARASVLVPGASEYGFTDEELDANDENRRPRRMKARELRVVGSTDIILSAGEVVANDCPELRDLQPWEEFWQG